MTTAELQHLFGHNEAAGSDETVAAARAFVRARRHKEEAERALALANEALRGVEDDFVRLLDRFGLASVEVDALRLTVCASRHYALPKEALDDAAVLLWLHRSGGRDLLERTINASKSSAFCRRLVEAGKPLSPQVRQVERRWVRTQETKADMTSKGKF